MNKRNRWSRLLPLGLALACVGLTAVRPIEAHKRITADGRVVPHWVRYPFEFQLCGMSLGARALDRERESNRIDRYSLFFVHGNPTAIVAPNIGTVTAGQAPAGSGVPLLETTPNAPWLSAVSVAIPASHVMWLYRRENYAMGFVVDALGFISAITVAGDDSPIAATQMGDPYHKVQLGDDFRKVLFRYGYPDLLTLAGEVGEPGAGGGQGGGGEGGGGAAGPGGGGLRGGGGGGRGGGAAASQGPEPPRPRFFASRDRNVQMLARELSQATATLQTRSSARTGAGSKSTMLPPLPPAVLGARSSALFGAPGLGGPGASGLGGPGGGAGGPGGGEGFGGGGGAAGGAGGGLAPSQGSPFATFQIDYRDTYNVMFTIRNNRVVRIFIWGDPDYFTDRQREAMRKQF